MKNYAFAALTIAVRPGETRAQARDRTFRDNCVVRDPASPLIGKSFCDLVADGLDEPARSYRSASAIPLVDVPSTTYPKAIYFVKYESA